MTQQIPLKAAPRPAVRRMNRLAEARGSGGLLLVLAIVVLIILGTATTSGFATLDNLRAILDAASISGIVAVSMTFLTLSGNLVSLGIQQSTALAAVLFLELVSEGRGVLLSVVICLAVGVVLGLIQGVVIALGMNSIITTLAVGTIELGALDALTQGETINSGGHSIGWLGDSLVLGVPIAIYAFVIITVIASVIASQTTFGRRALLMGANRNTADISGIRLSRVTVYSFILLSLGATIAGILTSAQLGQATGNELSSLTIEVIAAVLVGGTAITGGYGSPLRSALGACIIALLANVMQLHGFATGWQLAIEGALVVVVVCTLRLLSPGERQ
jgi:ribose transport system permease protein